MAEHRPPYYDEIERICDIAVADENARLQMEDEGGLTDKEESCTEASVRQLDELKRRITGDEYQPMIETAAPTHEQPGGPAGEYLYQTAQVGDLVQEKIDAPFPPWREMVDRIRKSVPSLPKERQFDVGYLLEVIDALEAGRL